jgi:hypothetical protein
MKEQEKKLLEGYRKLRPESKNLIFSTIMTAVMAEEAATQAPLPESKTLNPFGTNKEKP